MDDTFCEFFFKNKRVSRFLFLLKTRLDAGLFYLSLRITNKYECTNKIQIQKGR